MSTKTDIVIISYNCKDLTAECIKSIYATSGALDANIIVVDNASADGSVEFLREEFPGITVLANAENKGYAAAVNQGAKAGSADFIIISNADVIYHENALESMITFLQNNDKIAVCGPQQQYSDGSWEYSYGDFPGKTAALKNIFFITSIIQTLRRFFWKRGIATDNKFKSVPYIDGAVMAVKRKIFEQVRGFDEDYFFYTEEADFCYRIHRTDNDVVFLPEARVTHIRGGSQTGSGFTEKSGRMFVGSKILFCKKHYSENETRNFVKLEILHAGIMIILWKTLALIPKLRAKSESKVQHYRLMKKLFAEYD